MYKFILLASIVLFCIGCTPTEPASTNTPASAATQTPMTSPTASTETPVGDTTQTSIDWAGTYKGVLPCADCEGIETEVVLNDDGTFQQTRTYLGKDGDPDVSSGSFTWKEDGATVILASGEESTQYWVSEGRIVQLDTEGNKIEGEMAEKYVLPKV